MEERSQQRIKQLETVIEELKEKSSMEMKENQIESEEQLAQLKNFFELEKGRLEQKLLEDRQQYERKNKDLVEEFETKIREEQQNYEDEIDQWKEDYREIEQQSSMNQQNYEQQLALKAQQIDTLEKQLRELKQTLSANQQNYNAAIETASDKHSTELKEISSKYEKVKIELIEKDKEVINNKQRAEMLTEKLTKREEEYLLLQNEFKQNKQQLMEKIEELRNKCQKQTDEQLEEKIKYNREQALYQQQNEFNAKKIEEMKRQNEEVTAMYEEKLTNARQDYMSEMKNKTTSISEEKEALIEKLERTKKILKQSEQNFTQELGKIEREHALALQRIANLEEQKSEAESRSSLDSSHLQSQLSQTKETLLKERKNWETEFQKQKEAFLSIETERNSLVASYERDKALWDEKFKFLEEQKENAKREIQETTQKFEQSLSLLNSSKQAYSSHSLEQAISQKTQELEQQFSEKTAVLNQQALMQKEQFEEKSKKYEREIRQLNEQVLLLQHGKYESQQFQQKRMQELQDEQKQLCSEMESLKNEHESQLEKQSQQFDSERKQMKNKLQDIECKLKEAETKRTQFLFEREKDQTKWNMEKDQWVNKCNDLQDQLERIERKKETLLRENERLKGESRTRKNIATFSQQQQFSNTQKQQQMHLSKFSTKLEKNLNDITNAFQDDNYEDNNNNAAKDSITKSSRFDLENAGSLTYNFNFDRLNKK